MSRVLGPVFLVGLLLIVWFPQFLISHLVFTIAGVGYMWSAYGSYPAEGTDHIKVSDLDAAKLRGLERDLRVLVASGLISLAGLFSIAWLPAMWPELYRTPAAALFSVLLLATMALRHLAEKSKRSTFARYAGREPKES